MSKAPVSLSLSLDGRPAEAAFARVRARARMVRDLHDPPHADLTEADVRVLRKAGFHDLADIAERYLPRRHAWFGTGLRTDRVQDKLVLALVFVLVAVPLAVCATMGFPVHADPNNPAMWSLVSVVAAIAIVVVLSRRQD